CLVALSLVSMWIPMFWVPFLGLCMSLMLYHMQRRSHKDKPQICGRTVYVVNLTLIWSSLIMIAYYIAINYTDWISEVWLKNVPVNHEIPYIPILITGPVSVLICSWLLMSGRKHPFCRRCVISNGDPAERGFIGRVLDQESSTQMWLLLILSLLLTIGEYAYYVISFITTDLNSSDAFFFGWVPAIVYVMSLAYLSLRYSGLLAYYIRELSGTVFQKGNFSMVRFLIISGDHLFLAEPDSTSNLVNLQNSKYDTPSVLTVAYQSRISDWEAENYFKGTSGIDAKIRFLYRTDTEDSGSNIFHFAALIEDTNIIDEQSRLKGQWVTLSTLQSMMDQNLVAPLLMSEIHRIYNVTMAWKTYDRSGTRLYDIKNYRPAFRLRDLPNWDVDYNDSTWLQVADNNEDRPFFHLRKLWRKYIHGSGH
ncbi:MAG: hypothetical protein K2L93_06315, partial [Muribaculaceae bacterium]|nr:hypothetical protein [Muribaculaceae bacterium]